MEKLKFILLAVVGVLSLDVYAGMDSGGGKIVKDSNNPWFVNNTSQVNYCIERDSSTFLWRPTEFMT